VFVKLKPFGLLFKKFEMILPADHRQLTNSTASIYQSGPVFDPESFAER